HFIYLFFAHCFSLLFFLPVLFCGLVFFFFPSLYKTTYKCSDDIHILPLKREAEPPFFLYSLLTITAIATLCTGVFVLIIHGFGMIRVSVYPSASKGRRGITTMLFRVPIRMNIAIARTGACRALFIVRLPVILRTSTF